jgi:hypothetical protein
MTTTAPEAKKQKIEAHQLHVHVGKHTVDISHRMAAINKTKYRK